MREMKDSGIEWIGTIPFDWKCCKQKYEIQLINGRAYSDSEFEEDGKYRILRVGNLFSNPTWYTSSLELPPDKYCENGDLLYSWSMSYAPVIWSGEKVIYHYHIWKTKLSSNLNKKFAYYYLSALTDALKAKIHETTMGFITMGVMNNSYIAFPCLKEQEKIVSFLDSQCSEIDAISADIQKEIETLEQYKRSVITEAVTKGLNPDVEMKDSGIRWIGSIPKDWNVSRLKYVAKFFNGDRGKNYPSGEDLTDDGIAFLTSNNIHGLILDCSHEKSKFITEERYNRLGGAKIQLNDIVFCLRGSVGNCAINKSLTKGTVASSLMTIRPIKASPDFINYLLQTDICEVQTIKAMNGSCAANLSAENVSNYYFVEPPVTEQKKIAVFLDSKCSEIDTIMASKQHQLEILASYKKSLIYEYVTGKKEVPSWKQNT